MDKKWKIRNFLTNLKRIALGAQCRDCAFWRPGHWTPWGFCCRGGDRCLQRRGHYPAKRDRRAACLRFVQSLEAIPPGPPRAAARGDEGP